MSEGSHRVYLRGSSILISLLFFSSPGFAIDPRIIRDAFERSNRRLNADPILTLFVIMDREQYVRIFQSAFDMPPCGAEKDIADGDLRNRLAGGPQRQ